MHQVANAEANTLALKAEFEDYTPKSRLESERTLTEWLFAAPFSERDMFIVQFHYKTVASLAYTFCKKMSHFNIRDPTHTRDN